MFTSRARRMRQHATDAERLLWRYLRGRRMAGYKFRRQVVIEPYIVDFASIEARLIVEADGGQQADQRHYDAQRDARLEAARYRVMRFWNHEILTETEKVLEQIHEVLLNTPSP
ncbi:MAG: DNA methylase [Porticoccaceae bacterium]|nr:DNA methylase [Porticoccaceae bacterium]